MAMAGDVSSPNEAAIAAKRARSLMDKHQIQMHDLEEASLFGTGNAAGNARVYIPVWENMLSVAIGNYNDCLVDVYAGRLRFKGYDADVQVAQFMFTYMMGTAKRLCSEFMKQKGYTRYNATVGTAFKSAFTRELCIRLKILATERDALEYSPGQSLVVFKKAEVEAEFGTARYKESKFPVKSGKNVGDAIHAGASHGRSIPLHTELN